MKESLGRWWRQPDHFDWLSAYIADHGLQPYTRGVIGGAAASVALAAGALPLSSVGPRGVMADAVSALACVLGLAVASFWLVGWPSRRGSVIFALVANACFSSVCLVQSNSIVGLMGCCAFATIGGYIALFHTPRFMAIYLAIATATTAVLAARVFMQYDIVLGGFIGLLVGTVNLSVSCFVHMLMNFLRVDVLESERDPLTGVLNRRGFDRAARNLLAAPRDGEAHLIVAMVDLDRFKALNDDHGHAAGDRVLIAVAEVLRAQTRSSSVIGRVGGEEFLVAELTDTPDAATMADRLCRAITAVPYPVTASIGTAIAAVPTRDAATPALAELIDIADAAMYEAKRRGGNRTHPCHGLDDLFAIPEPPDAGQRAARPPESLFPNG